MKQKVKGDFDPEDEYLDRLKRSERRKRNALVVFAVIVSLALVGMVIFWR